MFKNSQTHTTDIINTTYMVIKNNDGPNLRPTLKI